MNGEEDRYEGKANMTNLPQYVPEKEKDLWKDLICFNNV